MKKRIISIALVIAALGILIHAGNDSRTSSAGFAGLTVYAAADDFDIEDGCLTYYSGSSSSVSIPSGVTSIAGFAFDGHSEIKSIAFPQTLKSIGYASFWGCSGLTGLSLPNSLTDISSCAFADCTGLKSVTLPASVKDFSGDAFYHCTALTAINVASGNAVYCSVDGVVYSKNKDTVIACPGAKKGSFTVPDSVKAIGEGAFKGCAGITGVSVPSAVKTIGDSAFASSGIKSFSIPSGVTKLGYGNFEFCESLTSVKIPNTVTNIGWRVFSGCSSLTTVTIPASVTKIDGLAFLDCSGLKSIVIPKSVTSITYGSTNESCFTGCNALRDVYFTGTEQQWKKIALDSNGKGVLGLNKNVTVHYNYTPVTLSVTAQPASVTVKTGATVSFTVKAKGDGLTYQWYYKKAGQTSWSKWGTRTTATTSAAANSTWDGMQVYCKVSDKYGNSVNSKAAAVTITGLKITTQPVSKTVVLGKSVTLSLKAEGTGLSYQWYFKKKGQTSFSKWNNRTHASETVTPNETWDGIQLYCIVKDSTESKEQSATIKVTVTKELKITSQPSSVTTKTGTNVTFTVKADGIGLSYQWYFMKKGQTSWTAWNSRTHASETVAPNATWDGIQLYCLVKDSAGKSVKSNTVKVTLSDVLAITAQPANVTASAGSNVTFTVKAKGIGLKYQWQFKKTGATAWSNWNGRTTASTTATANSSWNGMQVRCIVTDSAGNKVTSNAAKITIK